MDVFINPLGNEGFIAFIATYGLATVIVIFIIFFRDPKRFNNLLDQYKQLDDRYNDLYVIFRKLQEDYRQLESDIHPQTRRISVDQVRHLVFIGLDRDLYKLYYLMSKKIDLIGVKLLKRLF